MTETNLSSHACDVCGSSEAVLIEPVLQYTGGQYLHSCRSCGFVFAHERRDDEAIMRDWAEEMFTVTETFDVEEVDGEGYTGYTAKIPAVIARLTYALENFEREVGFAGKRVCDIGAGEGEFLEMIRDTKRPEGVFGVEPSAENCKLLSKMGLDNFSGTIEQFLDNAQVRQNFDVITMNWTLENTQSARRVMECVHKLLPEDGYVQVTTGSRILVPFKKPLHYYFNPRNPVDLHSFHFSKNALCNLMADVGFQPIKFNRYLDTDYLSVIGQKKTVVDRSELKKDDYNEVIDFFARWAKETEGHYR
ncbi:class I SAM-dependent methyltransferase [Thalassospira alkalitolerans]|uniref:class I SAM-dependent methyltransferase n=1 Tax=Thalassospira alkalitolerans TaxID=1293890 RepID=UPI0030ED2588|tara:strand:- start:31778 stop:32692 length:915 start_codon:yes stop_codon:yes gene_type:complete